MYLQSTVIRFYFVGDEDLLEIIGNSKNIPRLQKHFKKMFAGVASILLNEDSTQVLGISSKEGEQVGGGYRLALVSSFKRKKKTLVLYVKYSVRTHLWQIYDIGIALLKVLWIWTVIISKYMYTSSQ